MSESAETLRRAAALMRERAEADGSSGWQVEDANEGTEYHPLWMVTNDAFHNPSANDDEPWLAVEVHTGTKATAEHIASWHPAVALAVADWLDQAAQAHFHGINGPVYVENPRALAVARAYLGETACGFDNG